MSESLAIRVGRIISGSFNAVVDAIENAVPETVMEEAIREIERAITDVRSELGRLLASQHLADKRLADERRKLNSLVEQIEMAVQASRDDLAEAAIAKQLDIEAQLPVLEQTLQEAAVGEKELEGYIQALQARKREMQDELQQFRQSREATVLTGDPTGSSNNLDARVEQASNAFERVMENVSGVSNRYDNPNGSNAKKLAELEELSRNNRIRERLAEFKGKDHN